MKKCSLVPKVVGRKSLCVFFLILKENSNASELLFENVADFCEKGGVGRINDCFSDAKNPLPLSLASNLINIIAQV